MTNIKSLVFILLCLLSAMPVSAQDENTLSKIRKTERITVTRQSIVYLKNQPESINALTQNQLLKGKWLYIDLWATWCRGCVYQFRYKDQLAELLAQYPKVVPVYISLDNGKEKDKWERMIKEYNLKGYHLLINSPLHRDIRERLNITASMKIPRYMLVDPEGNIVNGELPLPYKMDDLKKELEMHLNQ